MCNPCAPVCMLVPACKPFSVPAKTLAMHACAYVQAILAPLLKCLPCMLCAPVRMFVSFVCAHVHAHASSMRTCLQAANRVLRCPCTRPSPADRRPVGSAGYEFQPAPAHGGAPGPPGRRPAFNSTTAARPRTSPRGLATTGESWGASPGRLVRGLASPWAQHALRLRQAGQGGKSLHCAYKARAG